jgi:hypothetical protein
VQTSSKNASSRREKKSWDIEGMQTTAFSFLRVERRKEEEKKKKKM